MTELPDGVLRVQRLGEDGKPVGGVAVFGVAPGALQFAIKHAADAFQQEGAKAAAGLAAIGEGARSLSMRMANLDPELLRILTRWKPRRGWKGHGAPPLWLSTGVMPYLGVVRPARRKPNRRVGW